MKRAVKKKPDKEFEKLKRPEVPDPDPVDVPSVLLESVAWSNANTIAKKWSAGTTTTATYQQQIDTFLKMNEMAQVKGPVLPQSAMFEKHPEGKDQFDRRKVKQANDISFEDDSDDYEEIRNLKRQPRTILNEEHLKEFLDKQTVKLDLESHYWLKNPFLQYIGRMAENLRVLSLRRMKFIDNPTFAEIFKYLKHLRRIDLMDCEGLYTSATSLLLTKNKKLEEVQFSGCKNGVDDLVMAHMANLSRLTFIDVSFCTQITDEGLKPFEGKKFDLISIVVNGLPNISSVGLAHLIGSCTESLIELEAALMDQPELKGEFLPILA